MKIILVVTISLLLAIVGASLLQSDTGYVLIKIHDYRVELNLVFFALLLILLFVIAYLLLRFIVVVYTAPHNIKKWRAYRKLINSQQKLTRGFIALGEGEYKKAQKILTRLADTTAEPLVPLLAAANAAQQRGDSNLSEYLLNRAENTTPEAKQALVLTRAERYLNLGNLQEAQDELNILGGKFKRNPIFLRLQANIFLRSENWNQLIKILPQLKSKSNLPESEIKDMERKTYRNLLLAAKDSQQVNSGWKQIPKQLRGDKNVAIEYAHKLVETGQNATAAKHIVSILNSNWDDDLANLYSRLDTPDATGQIKNMERWLGEHKDNHIIHLGLGRLYARKKLWVMVKESLEQSLKISDSAEVRGLLLEAREHIKDFSS